MTYLPKTHVYKYLLLLIITTISIAGLSVSAQAEPGSVTSEGGLIYLHGRYYDPALGRFVSADPAEPTGNISANRYAYADNQPSVESDTNGLRGLRVHVGPNHRDLPSTPFLNPSAAPSWLNDDSGETGKKLLGFNAYAAYAYVQQHRQHESAGQVYAESEKGFVIDIAQLLDLGGKIDKEVAARQYIMANDPQGYDLAKLEAFSATLNADVDKFKNIKYGLDTTTAGDLHCFGGCADSNPSNITDKEWTKEQFGNLDPEHFWDKASINGPTRLAEKYKTTFGDKVQSDLFYLGGGQLFMLGTVKAALASSKVAKVLIAGSGAGADFFGQGAILYMPEVLDGDTYWYATQSDWYYRKYPDKLKIPGWESTRSWYGNQPQDAAGCMINAQANRVGMC